MADMLVKLCNIPHSHDIEEKARSLHNGKLHRWIESKKFRENQGM